MATTPTIPGLRLAAGLRAGMIVAAATLWLGMMLLDLSSHALHAEQPGQPDSGRVEPSVRSGNGTIGPASYTSPRTIPREDPDSSTRIASINRNGMTQQSAEALSLQPLSPSPRGNGRATFFSQRHDSLPNGGQMYCGPAAAINALGWLGQTAALRNDSTWLAAITELGACMNTDPVQGTTPAQLLSGLERYLQEKYSPAARISYQGCREVPSHFSEGMRPQLWRMGSSGSRAVILNIGWYKKIEGTSIYQRVGGHWVSLKDAQLTSEGDVLVVLHDPYPKNGGREHRTVVTRLTEGTLTGGDVRGRCMALGFFKLDDRYPRITKADCGIIDGVVVMDLGVPGQIPANTTTTASRQIIGR